MKLPRLISRSKGFTLIELLTVIAIIGILAAMLIPIVGAAKKTANKAVANSNCSGIAKAYAVYATGGNNPRNITAADATNSGSGVTGWAVYLAGKTQVNSAEAWFVKQDAALGDIPNFPQQIADLVSNPTKATAQSDFASTKPKSWAVVVDGSKSADGTTYPVIWTRGLKGTAWAKDSPWGAEGGHVAFLDGHSTWLDSGDLTDGKVTFTDQKTGKPTSDIKQAIKATATSKADVLEDTI